MEIEIVKSKDEFENLKISWRKLLEGSHNDNIFLSWEWMYNWWVVYGKEDKILHIIILRENGEIIAIAPLYLAKKYFGGIRELRFLGDNIICSDYLEFIVRRERQEDGTIALLKEIKENWPKWDIVKLRDVPSISNIPKYAKPLFPPNSLDINERHNICYFVNLKLTWEEINESFHSVIKTILKRKEKKLQEMKNSEFIEIADSNGIENYFMDLVRLNIASLTKRRGISPFLSNYFTSFHKLVLTELNKRKMAKLYFLKVNGSYIAGIYILNYKNKYLFYQAGYDPEWEWLSPGTLLFKHVIRKAHDNNVEEFDFLRGEEIYKSLWTESKRVNMAINIYNKTLKGKILQICERGNRKIRMGLGFLMRKVFT